MSLKYHHMIATGLVTCLTICQIPAEAQVQGQRPRILKSAQTDVGAGSEKSRTASKTQTLVESSKLTLRPQKEEVVSVYSDIPENGKIQLGTEFAMTEMKISVNQNNVRAESLQNMQSGGVFLGTSLNSGLLLTALVLHSQSVTELQGRSLSEATGFAEPTFGLGYKIINSRDLRWIGGLQYSPKLGVQELSLGPGGFRSSNGLKGGDEIEFLTSVAMDLNSLIFGVSATYSLIGEQEAEVTEQSGRNYTEITDSGYGLDMETYLETKGRFIFGGSYEFTQNSERQSSSLGQRNLRAEVTGQFLSVYSGLRFGSDFLIRGRVGYAMIDSSSGVEGQGYLGNLGLRYQF